MGLLARPLTRTFLAAIIAAGLTLIVTNLSFFALLELKGLDLLFALRGVQPPPSQIVIVAIDELSLSEMKRQWPVSYTHLDVYKRQARPGLSGLRAAFRLSICVRGSQRNRHLRFRSCCLLYTSRCV